jgi:hypothetical protein
VSYAPSAGKRGRAPRVFWIFWIFLVLSACVGILEFSSPLARLFAVFSGLVGVGEGIALIFDVRGVTTRTVAWLRSASNPSMLSTLGPRMWRFWGLIYLLIGSGMLFRAVKP